MIKKMLIALALCLCLLTCAFAEESVRTIEFELDGYGMGGGMLNVTFSDGTVHETGGWGFFFELDHNNDVTLGELLGRDDIVAFEAVHESDAFEGFMPFEIVITEDEDGFEQWNYVRMSDALYTAQELLALPAPDTYVVYAAKWAGIDAESYYVWEDGGEMIHIPSATLMANGGTITCQTEDGDVYDMNFSVASLEPGMTLGELLSLDTIRSMSMEGKTFTGFIVYETGMFEAAAAEDFVPEENMLSFELFEGWVSFVREYEVIAEGLSLEELGALSYGERDLLILATWQ